MKRVLVTALFIAFMSVCAVQAQLLSGTSSGYASQRVKVLPKAIEKDVPSSVSSSTTPTKARAATQVPTAYYKRPAGTFFAGMTVDGSLFFYPFLCVPPEKEITFYNDSKNGSFYLWEYDFTYTQDASGSYQRTTTESCNDYNLDITYGIESRDIPVLTATNQRGSSVYDCRSLYKDVDKNVVEEYPGIIISVPDPLNDYFNSESVVGADYVTHEYVSPKFFAAGARVNATESGVIYYTVAREKLQHPLSCWFGRNWMGLNAMGIYVEKPQYSYALRGIAVNYNLLKLKSGTTADLTATVYKVTKHEGGELQLGDVLGVGTATVSNTTGQDNNEGQRYGQLYFPMKEFDELGFSYEVTLTIDEPIAVVLTGYDNANIEGFTMMISEDRCDEGYGEVGYLMEADPNGTITAVHPLSTYWDDEPDMYSAPTIFLDVIFPILMPYEASEEAKHDFKAAGESYDFGIYTYNLAEEIVVESADGGDLPSWLTCTLKQKYEDKVVATLKAAPLPSGTSSRSAKIRFSVPGTSLVYTCTQGSSQQTVYGDVNNDKQVNVSDVNLIVSDILARGNDPQFDINGDGQVNVTDVNLVVSVILTINQ